MKLRLPLLSLLAAALVIGLFLVGYLWPVSQADFAETAEDQWRWSASAPPVAERPLPGNLTSFWPGKKPLSSAEQAAAAAAAEGARHDWMLIGIIRQGGPPSAVLLDPEGKLLTLSMGNRGQRVPDWQLDPLKQELVHAVLQRVKDVGSWQLYRMLVQPREMLGGRSAIEAVSSTNLHEITQMAVRDLAGGGYPIEAIA